MYGQITVDTIITLRRNDIDLYNGSVLFLHNNTKKKLGEKMPNHMEMILELEWIRMNDQRQVMNGFWRSKKGEKITHKKYVSIMWTTLPKLNPNFIQFECGIKITFSWSHCLIGINNFCISSIWINLTFNLDVPECLYAFVLIGFFLSSYWVKTISISLHKNFHIFFFVIFESRHFMCWIFNIILHGVANIQKKKTFYFFFT